MMANNLRRFIKRNETVVTTPEHGGRKFVCMDGSGLNPKARGAGITGEWADGTRGNINGSWIDIEATKKLKEAETAAKVTRQLG